MCLQHFYCLLLKSRLLSSTICRPLAQQGMQNSVDFGSHILEAELICMQ